VQPQTSTGRRARTILAGSCAGHALADGLSASVYVVLPVLAQALNLSYANVGFLRAAHSTAMMLFELPSGLLAERTGERPLLVFGLVCGGTGYLLLSWSADFQSVLLALFVAGLGAAFQHSLNSSLVSKTFEGGDRQVALGAYNAAGDVGKLIATGSLSFLLGAGLAWNAVAFAYGLIAVTGGLVIFTLYRRLKAGGPPEPPPPEPGEVSAANTAIRDRKGFTALSLIVTLDTAVQDGFLIFIAFIMLEKQVPTGLAAFAVVLTLLGGVAGKFGCGFLAKRLGAVPAFVLVKIATAVGIVAVYFASPIMAFCLLPLLGIVLQGSSTITYGAVGEFTSNQKRSRGFGIIYSLASLASISAPIGFGYVGDLYGLGIAMLGMAFTVCLTLPACLVLAPALKRLRSAPAGP